MLFKPSLIRIFPSNCETFTDRTYAKLSLWTMLTQSNYSSSQLSSDPPAWGVILVLFRPTHLKETAHSDVWPVQSRWNPFAIVIIKIYSTFAAKHASAPSRIYALAHCSHRGGRGGRGGQLHVNNGSFVSVIGSNASCGAEFDLKVRNKQNMRRSGCALIAQLRLSGHCQRFRPLGVMWTNR